MTFSLHNTGTLDIFMTKFDAKKVSLMKWQLCELRLSHFYGLCILTSFSLLANTLREYQIGIAYCLFHFSYFPCWFQGYDVLVSIETVRGHCFHFTSQ